MAQPSTWALFLSAIRAQESGGNYAEDAPGCLGAYCWNNQASWDSMASAVGQGHYVGQNPATLPPQVQDTVASENLARAYHSAGNSLLAAAEWWNGGVTHSVSNPGLPAQRWAPRCGGGSSQAYACQVLMRMQLGGHFLSGSGAVTTAAIGPQSGSGGTVTVGASADCLVGFGGIPGTSLLPDIFASGGNIGAFCLLTRSQARGFMGALILSAGVLVMVPGVFLLLAAVGAEARGPFGKAAETTGAMVALIPGAEGIGAAVAGSGAAARASAGQTQQRRQARRDERRSRQLRLTQDEKTGTGRTDAEVEEANR